MYFSGVLLVRSRWFIRWLNNIHDLKPVGRVSNGLSRTIDEKLQNPNNLHKQT